MKFLSLFSGIEAASVAWSQLGWTCVGLSEIDPFASAVLAKRFPNVPNLGDVTKITKGDLDALKEKHGAITVICAGSPCQSFSIGGKRGGLSDPRGNLMWQFVRVVDTVRPKWILWENVAGVLSSGGGADFACLLQALADIGYSLSWRVLDAQWFGVPQQRRRVYLVGHLTDPTSCFKALFERKSVQRDHQESREQRQDNSPETGESIGGNDQPVREYYEHHPSDSRTKGPKQIGNTVRARYGTGGGNIPFVLESERSQVRKLTPIECERLQGFPDDWTAISYRGKEASQCPHSPRYKALGNTMAVPVIRWIGEGIMEIEADEQEK